MSEPLTPTQRKIAKLASTTALTEKELAAVFGLAVGTIKNHLHHVYERLGLESRLALVIWYHTHAEKPPIELL